MDLQHLLTRHSCRTPVAVRSAPSFHLSLTLIIMASHIPWSGVQLKRVSLTKSRANFELACALVDATDWDAILQGDCIDEIWDKWSNHFMSIMEQCIPHCTLPKRRKLPWVDSSIRQAISRRNNYLKRSRQNPSYRDKYKQSRNKVLSMLRNFFQTLHPSNPKHFGKLWSSWMARPQHPSQSLSRTTYS